MSKLLTAVCSCSALAALSLLITIAGPSYPTMFIWMLTAGAAIASIFTCIKE